MQLVNYLFGERPATRVAKGIFYLAWLSMLPNFFNASWLGVGWMNISMPLMLFAFFTTGGFMTFASKESLIDYWRPKTRLGREIADPIKGTITLGSMRVIGVLFMVVTLYFAYDAHREWKYNGSQTTRSSK